MTINIDQVLVTNGMIGCRKMMFLLLFVFFVLCLLQLTVDSSELAAQRKKILIDSRKTVYSGSHNTAVLQLVIPWEEPLPRALRLMRGRMHGSGVRAVRPALILAIPALPISISSSSYYLCTRSYEPSELYSFPARKSAVPDTIVASKLVSYVCIR